MQSFHLTDEWIYLIIWSSRSTGLNSQHFCLHHLFALQLLLASSSNTFLYLSACFHKELVDTASLSPLLSVSESFRSPLCVRIYFCAVGAGGGNTGWMNECLLDLRFFYPSHVSSLKLPPLSCSLSCSLSARISPYLSEQGMWDRWRAEKSKK